MVGLSSETIEQEHNTLLKTPTLKFKKDHHTGCTTFMYQNLTFIADKNCAN